MEVLLSNFIQKKVKDTVDLGEGTSPKLALGLGFEKQAPFSIPNQVEVVSSIPGEVVAGDDIFFLLRHAFLVFFGGVDGAGVGSSGAG